MPPGITGTPTLLVITEVVDLAPDMPADTKVRALVRSVDGSYRVLLYVYGTKIEDLPLRSGDVMVQAIPPANQMRAPKPMASAPPPLPPTVTVVMSR